MAEGYRTEEEQIEALKNWWQENGKSTVFTILVVVAGVFGWQAYQNQQQAKAEAASALYQEMLTAANASGGQPSDEQLSTARHLAQTLRDEYAGSAYAQFATLYQARFAVENGELQTAEQILRDVLADPALPEIAIQSRLRLAQVLYAQQRYEEALQELQTDAGGYAASYEELKGDIYRAQGDNVSALAAYQTAMDLTRSAQQPASSGLLGIKLQQLKSATGAAGEA